MKAVIFFDTRWCKAEFANKEMFTSFNYKTDVYTSEKYVEVDSSLYKRWL